MSNNLLQGQIPHELFELQSLQVLDLSNNTLEGKLGPELDELKSKFGGALSRGFGKLVNLESLKLNNGDFLPGNIPEEIGNLTQLRALSLQKNHFSGRIPSLLINF
ncbi:leucine-rich repeat-containing protein, partial [Tanacetum coccineum]